MRFEFRPTLLFVVFCWAGSLLAQAPNEPLSTAQSKNKRYSVEIAMTTLDKATVAVFEIEKDARKNLWVQTLADEADADPLSEEGFLLGQPLSVIFQGSKLRAHLSDDGRFVAIRFPGAMTEVVLLVLGNGGIKKAISFEDIDDAIESAGGPTWDWAGFGPHESDIHLELMTELNKRAVYALWNSATPNVWVTVDLEKVAIGIANQEEAQRLDAEALLRARAVIAETQPGRLKKMFGPVLKKAAEIIPGVTTVTAGLDDFFETEGAYRFLASRKNPEDKQLIAGLLEGEGTPSTRFSSGDSGTSVTLVYSSRERRLGDELMALWEGKVSEDENEADSMGSGTDGPLHSLGKISGRIQLPFAPPAKSGGIWAHLIPANVPERDWKEDSSVIALCHETEEGTPEEFRPGAHLDFVFDALPPGKYRLRAVWDRRPPIARAGNVDARPALSPGDYESDESDVIELAAGQSVEELTLTCTNRVGQAEEYYAADELWKKKEPERATVDENEEVAPQETVLLTAPASQWLIRTNASNQITLKSIKVVETAERGSSTKRKSLRVTFKKAASDEMALISAELIDEHGCKFESPGFGSTEREHEISFSPAPFGSKTMELKVLREDAERARGRPYRAPRNTMLGSFTLTNLLEAKPEDWKAVTFPAKCEVDGVTVELRHGRIGEQHLSPAQAMQAYYPHFYNLHRFGPPEVAGRAGELSFLKDGKPAEGWHKLSGKFRDRWGNEASSMEAFCRKESVIKYIVEVARDPRVATFEKSERMETALERVPGPGENVALNFKSEVQGRAIELISVSGLGEFRYENGELLSAKSELEPDRFFPAYLPVQARVEPKLRVKGFEGGMPSPFGRITSGGAGQSESVLLASRTPHLVCRLPSLRTDTLIALLEQDTSVAVPFSPSSEEGRDYMHGVIMPRRMQSSVAYLPLDLKPGEQGKRLTFIVQKVRTAEFLIPARTDK